MKGLVKKVMWWQFAFLSLVLVTLFKGFGMEKALTYTLIAIIVLILISAVLGLINVLHRDEND